MRQVLLFGLVYSPSVLLGFVDLVASSSVTFT